MLQNWFILMPEISLLSYLAVAALVNRYRAGKTAKTFLRSASISCWPHCSAPSCFTISAFFPAG